jgi:hypothetical protein
MFSWKISSGLLQKDSRVIGSIANVGQMILAADIEER